MSLKKQLGVRKRLNEQLAKEKDIKRFRSPEDWKIVESYISKLLIKFSSSGNVKEIKKFGRKKKYVSIYYAAISLLLPKDEDNRTICLKDGSELRIKQSDIKRFCEQHKRQLRYLIHIGPYDDRGIVRREVKKGESYSFLIEV